MVKRALLRLERASTIKVGVVLLVMAVLVGFSLFQKSRIMTTLHGGQQVSADFNRDYHLRPYVTKVKIAGVRVGVVTGVEHGQEGTTHVTMKVDDGTPDKLRSAPSAAIRPTTLLGGNYYVDLKPGGDPATFGGVIPTSRTTTPVELDRVLEVLQPSARTSLRRTVARLDETLGSDSRPELRALLASAPDSFRQATPVLVALRGTRPQQDLTTLTRDLGAAARAMTQNQGELEKAISGLRATSVVLDQNSALVSQAIVTLPGTLRTSRVGLGALSTSLDQLKATSDAAMPIASSLDTLLGKLEPALAAARPVVRELRPTLADIRPVVVDLVPSVGLANGILSDVDGGPLSRLNGPVMTALRSPWRGTGLYAGGGNDHPMYIELANLIAGMDNASRMTDRNGSTIHFQPGFGLGSVSGLPISLEQLTKSLLYPGGSR
jgi:phospholipid/cholesterol/gamma-HCH transport system substrate-binding protein